MKYAGRSIATAIASTIALGPGSMTISAQATVDRENRYSNVGVIMVWRVDDAGTPVELRGFASGTLIRDRVLVTAGHFTAPATALGALPPSIRIFASFSPTDAKSPKTRIPVARLAPHPSMPHCPPPPQCDPTDEILVSPLEPGIADVGLVFLARSAPGIRPARGARHSPKVGRSANDHRGIRDHGATRPEPTRGHRHVEWKAAHQDFDTAKSRRRDWGLWSIPSYVCSGDSGGGIFLNPNPSLANNDALAANVSDGGLDCRRHNNNNRLDTGSIQTWINDMLRQHAVGT